MNIQQIRLDLEEILAYQNSPGSQPVRPKTVMNYLLHLARVVETLERRMDALEERE